MKISFRVMCFSLALLVAVLLYPLGPAQAVWVWTPDTGKWVNPKHAPKDTAKQQFEFALAAFQNKEFKLARREFEKIIKFYPGSIQAPDAQYYMGRCFEEMQKPYAAFKAYQKVIESYPYSEKIDEIIQRQYRIGTYYFNYVGTKVLGVPFSNPMEVAVEVFKKIVENAPYGTYGDVSQYKLGESYKKAGNFVEASLAFQKMLDNYPQSKFRDDARYQVALCTSQASLKPDYDQQMTKEAIDQFEDFVARRPESELARNARGTIDVLKEKKSRNLLETARFYERRSKFLSAYTYYKEITERYPETSCAFEAEHKARELQGRKNR